MYLISPVAATVLFTTMERGYQAPDPAGSRMSSWFASAMLVFAATAVVAGFIPFLFPRAIAPWWPWPLTPLTARVIGGWFLLSSALQWMLSRQRTLDTARVGLLASLIVTTLLLMALSSTATGSTGRP